MSTGFPATYYETRFVLTDAPDPLPAVFAVITACNPMNRFWSDRMNRKADLRLERFLKRRGLSYFRVTGCSPDGRHAEPGWAIVTDLKSALAIARRYKQFAIWSIENDLLELIHSSGSLRESLGSFKNRVNAAQIVPSPQRNTHKTTPRFPPD